MRLIRFALTLGFGLILVNTALRASDIQPLGLTPTLALPGDTVLLRFQVDGGVPAGLAEVLIGGKRYCEVGNSEGVFFCALNVPHGGDVNYQIRFTDMGGVVSVKNESFRSGGLRIVRVGPISPEVGRSAQFFAKLDSFDPRAVPAVTGTITISALGGDVICSIALPAQTFCQAQLGSVGRQEFVARYSGDNHYGALTSAPYAVLVRKPSLTNIIPYNFNPLAIPGLDKSEPGFSKPSPSGERAAGGARIRFDNSGGYIGSLPVIDYSVGTVYPLTVAYEPLVTRSMTDDFGIFANDVSQSRALIYRKRGQIFAPELGTIRRYADGRFLVQTTAALVPEDTNAQEDVYLVGMSGTQWLSARADGSAAPSGVQIAHHQDNEIVVFSSVDPGFVAADQNQIVDYFVYSPGRALLRVPVASASIVEVSADAQTVLLQSTQALAASDTDSINDLYRFEVGAGFSKISAALPAGQPGRVFSAALSPEPNAGVVYQQDDSTSPLVWFRDSGRTELPRAPIAGEWRVTDAQVLTVAGRNRFRVNLLSGVAKLETAEWGAEERGIFGGNVAVSANADVIAVQSSLVFNRPLLPATLIVNRERNSFPAEVVYDTLISDDGDRAVFVTLQALLPEDIDTTPDIYFWRRGTNQLTLLTNSSILSASVFRVLSFDQASNRIGFSAQVSVTDPLQLFSVSALGTSLTSIPVPPGSCRFVYAQANPWLLPTCRENEQSNIYRIDSRNGATTRVYQSDQTALGISSSADGQHVLFRYQAAQTPGYLYWIQDVAAQSSEQIPSELFNSIASLQLSPDGRFIAIGKSFNFSDGQSIPPPPNGSVEVYDMTTRQVRKMYDGKAPTFATFSADSCTLVWVGTQAALSTQANPFCKLRTDISIIRVMPSVPVWSQRLRVDTVITHKSNGPAPTGVVRIEGYGGQCDAPLQAQGNIATARCDMKIGQEDFDSIKPLQAVYLGDSNYADSEDEQPFAIRKTALSGAIQVDPTANIVPGYVRVRPSIQGIDFAHPLRGTIAVNAFGGQPCYLSVQDIANGSYCTMFLFYENSIVGISLDDPNYTLSASSASFLSQGVLLDGFESNF